MTRVRRRAFELKRRLGDNVRPDRRKYYAVRRRLASKHLHGAGIEIGALHTPLRLRRGVRVRYVDRLSNDRLREQYPEHANYEFVKVDLIDDGENLGALPPDSTDFIIANHFLEHCEDPIRTLQNHFRVLRPGATLYMAVPDKRRTFDRDRPVTTLEHVVRDYVEGPAWSRTSHYKEWAEHIDHVPWDHVPERARHLEEIRYSIHFHVWTPPELLELLLYCRRELSLGLDILALEANLHEFIAILRKAE